MGNTVSDNANPVNTFGKIHPKDNEKARPGYYFNTTSKLYQGTPIEVLPDEHSFKKLKYGYAKSNLRVFYNGKAIPDADPKTFTIIPRKEKTPFNLNCVLGRDVKNGKIRWYKFGNKIHEE